tara:strand:- start:11214 stop:11798 length:585 start_codon:yes stop_codon:yes gene_type:complete
MKNIENYLNSVGKQFVKDSRKLLSKAGKGGGKLEKSIASKVKKTSDGYSLQFFMEDYGTFVDKGVRGAGGTIPNGKYKGTWGGKRFYIDWRGKKKQSPYKYGSGTGTPGGLTKGIASWTRKKGLQPRSEGGQFMSPKGLNYVIRRNIWIRGIHGISFFQKPLGEAVNSILDSDMLVAIKEDILDGLIKAGWTKE